MWVSCQFEKPGIVSHHVARLKSSQQRQALFCGGDRLFILMVGAISLSQCQ